jgi:hypothetical protein
MAYSRLDISTMQKEIAPEIYNKIDLDFMPERFRTTLDSNPDGMFRWVNPEVPKRFLQDKEEVEIYRQLTLMGDPIADAFAAKFNEIGFANARAMLDKALDQGIDSVPDAPQELIRLIEELHKEPEWIDWPAIERFHKRMRVVNAVTQEYMMRIAFMMTYMNGYQGLPMIMTGQLTGESAAGRMKETTSTFKMATLPNAMRPGGVAFKSAAKVRVMHAMVRMNLLKHKDKWNFEVYGVPIPQVDQMGAALGFNFMSSLMSVKTKKPFNRNQKDGIEASRYLASLLGLHDYFLSDQRGEIIKSWSMLGATLRDKVDPRSTALNQATLHAYTRTGHSLADKFMHMIDVRNTRFLYTKLVGKEKATEMGVEAKLLDPLSTVALAAIIGSRLAVLYTIRLFPGGKNWVNNWAIKETLRQLDMAGEAQYKTDEKQYSMG